MAKIDLEEEAVKRSLGFPHKCPVCEKVHRDGTKALKECEWRITARYGVEQRNGRNIFSDYKIPTSWFGLPNNYYIPIVNSLSGVDIEETSQSFRDRVEKILTVVRDSKTESYWAYQIGNYLAVVEEKRLRDHKIFTNLMRMWEEWHKNVDEVRDGMTEHSLSFRVVMLYNNGKGGPIVSFKGNGWTKEFRDFTFDELKAKSFAEVWFYLQDAGLSYRSIPLAREGKGSRTFHDYTYGIVTFNRELTTMVIDEVVNLKTFKSSSLVEENRWLVTFYDNDFWKTKISKGEDLADLDAVVRKQPEFELYKEIDE